MDMSSDDRTCVAPPPEGRHRLKIHALDPVMPSHRARTASPSLIDDESTTALPRPRGFSIRAGTTSRGRGRAALESVAFDPFSDFQGFSVLLKSPEINVSRRTDPRAVSEFRVWLLRHFPRLVRTFQTLGLIMEQPTKPRGVVHNLNAPKRDVTSQHDVQGIQHHPEIENEGKEEDGAGSSEEENEADCGESWRLIFRHATVVSAAPGNIVVNQGVTQAGNVYFLLNGHCDLSFRPTLLPNNEWQTPRHPMLPATSSSMTSYRHLRELAPGDFFGLDVAAFGFRYFLISVTARTAHQRNILGLREAVTTYLLSVPFAIIQQLQRRLRADDRSGVPPTFPYLFAPEAELFLRNTFLFRGMADSSRRFLAAHLHPVVVAREEYLFTPGQPVQVFIINTGQLILGAPREERAGKRETAELELEILQAHDSVGLMEATVLETAFERYCVVTSAGGARAYALPPTVLLTVLAQEPAAFELIREWVAQRKSWFDLRRATALAQCRKLTTEDSEPVVRLTLANQRRSKLACSRCGWSGHVSTSLSCVRAQVPIASTRSSSIPLLDRRPRGSREDKRASRQQKLGSRSSRSSDVSVVLPVQQRPVLPRMNAHRRLQVDSMALQALQISKLSIVKRLIPNRLIGRNEKTEEEQRTRLPSDSRKNDAVRVCALTRTLQRLEAALTQNKTTSVQ